MIQDRSGAPLELLPLLDFEKLKVLENKNDMLVLKVNDLKMNLTQMESDKVAHASQIKSVDSIIEKSHEDNLKERRRKKCRNCGHTSGTLT